MSLLLPPAFQCSDHRDAERRLVFRNPETPGRDPNDVRVVRFGANGPRESFQNVPATGPGARREAQRQIQEQQAIADSAFEWEAIKTGLRGESGGKDLIDAWQTKRDKGDLRPWLKSAPDIQARIAVLSARARGAVQDGNDPSAFSGLRPDVDAAYRIRMAQARGAPATRVTYVTTAADSAKVFMSPQFANHYPSDAVPDIREGYRRGRPAGDSVLGMPDKILPTRAYTTPDRPNQYYVPDVYTGGLKLDRNAIRGDMEFDRFAKRQQEYVSYVESQNTQFEGTLAVIKARIDELSFGPERQQMVELYNRYIEERRVWGEDLIAMGDSIHHLEKDEKGNLKKNSAGMYIEHRGDVGNDALAPVWDVAPDKRHIFASQYYKADRAAKEMPAMHARLIKEWEQLNVQFKEGTKKRYVDAVVQYRMYQGLKMAPGVKPKELRAAASNAVKALDALGGHLYTERAGIIAPPELRAQFADAANKEFGRRGIPVDEVFLAEVADITPDRNGVPALLKLRKDILSEASLKNPDDVPLRKALINAIERERAYLVERGGMNPEKIGDLAREGTLLETMMLADLEGKTNVLIRENAEPALILAAAQKEYYELQAYDTPEANARKKKIFNRETPFGIVQQQYAKQHETLKADTDQSVRVEPAGIDGMRLILDDIRAEGSFLHKHAAQMAPEFQDRLKLLRTLQDTAVSKMVTKAVDLTRGFDPIGTAKEIEAVLPDLFRWEPNALDPKLVQNTRAVIAARVLAMREDVNSSILAAKKTKPLDLALVDVAVKNIIAEGRLLRTLRLDEKRVQNIGAELSMLQDLSKQIDDTVTAEVQPKKGMPTLASFRKADQLLQSEAKMIREAFKAMPQPQIDRLKSIDARRASLVTALSAATKAAVDGLDLKTDTILQIRNARELLEREIELKGGPGMSDVKELQRLTSMREKIWKAEGALSARPAPELTPAPTVTAPPVASKAAPTQAPVVAPKAVPTRGFKPTSAPVPTAAPAPSPKVVDTPARAPIATPARASAPTAVPKPSVPEPAPAPARAANVEPAPATSVEVDLSALERDALAEQRRLIEVGDRDSLQKAVQILHGRMMQLKVETDFAIRNFRNDKETAGSGVTKEGLAKDFFGTEIDPGLMVAALGAGVDEKTQRFLTEISAYLQEYNKRPDAPSRTAKDF